MRKAGRRSPWYAGVSLLVILSVAAVNGAEESAIQYPAAVQLKIAAPSGEAGNTYARGLSGVLKELGTPVEYERIMGLSGLAFILQVDTAGPSVDGHIDAAWWPNDAWGFALGVPVLSRTTGWRVGAINCEEKADQRDAAAQYQRAIEAALKKSLAAGRPVLLQSDACFVAIGYDAGSPPLLGYTPRPRTTKFHAAAQRIGTYPWGAYVLEERVAALQQGQADMESLRHALALGSEKAMPASAPGSGTRFTGEKAWAAWLRFLKSDSQAEKGAWDQNMIIHLRYNREAAVAYLREMAGRYPGPAGEHLTAAADLYTQVLEAAAGAEFPSKPAREGALQRYAAMVEQMGQLEAQAMVELGLAVKALEAR